jgi:hypothetical protein
VKLGLFLFSFVFALSSFAVENRTLSCELAGKSGQNKAKFEMTYTGKLNFLLDEAVKSKSPMTVEVSIDNEPSQPVSWAASYFGFEPNMYQASATLENGAKLLLTFDAWSVSTVVVEMKIGTKKLSSGSTCVGKVISQ